MKITKTKNGSYSVNLYKDDIRKHITAKTYAECKNKATEWLNSNVLFNDDKLTVRQAISKYIELNKSVLSPTSVRSYNGILKNYLQDIMFIDIHELTSQQLQNAINEDIKKVSTKTESNALGLLSASLKEYDIALPKHKLPQKIKKDIYVPTKQEVQRFIDASYGDLKVAILFAIYLGLRRSEICALTPGDFDGKCLHINKALVRDVKKGYVTKTTKTVESTRVLAVPNVLIPHMKELPLKLTPDSISKKFIRLRNKIGIPMRFHDFRHYFVSSLMANSVDYSYIRSYTGHKSNNMINKVYGHLTPERQKEVVGIINTLLD